MLTGVLHAAIRMRDERLKVAAFGPAAGKVERAVPAAVAPGDRGTTPKAPAVALPTVTFAASDKSPRLPPDKVILEVAEENGVEIDYSCRVGICGVCKVKLLSGRVSMAVEEALTAEDKTAGIVLAC